MELLKRVELQMMRMPAGDSGLTLVLTTGVPLFFVSFRNQFLITDEI